MSLSHLFERAVSTATLDADILDLKQIQAGKYFFLGALTMLFYDHLLTLPEEVETVWKRKKTWILYIFLLVRYYAVAAVIVVSFGYFSTTMTRERCAKWMLFLPLGITMPLTLMPGVLMIVRVYALWDRNKFILFGLSTYLLAQMAAGLWEYTVPGGTPAPLPLDNYEYHFCIYLPPKYIGRASTLFILMELTFDSMIFLLTVIRTTYMHMRHRHTGRLRNEGQSLIGNLVRDGAFYFGVIFSFNLTWVLMILHAPTGLRAIASIPSACVNTTMICRITLNLRTTVYGPAKVDVRTANSIPLTDVSNSRTKRRPPVAVPGRRTPDQLEIGVHIETEYEADSDPDQDVKHERSHGYAIPRELPFSNGNGFGDTVHPFSPAPAYGESTSPHSDSAGIGPSQHGETPLLRTRFQDEFGEDRAHAV